MTKMANSVYLWPLITPSADGHVAKTAAVLATKRLQQQHVK